MESPSKTSELFSQLQRIAAMPKEQKLFEEWHRMLEAAPGSRQKAAICICFAGNTFLDSHVLLTMRSSDLPTHANQVAFPGGSIEPQDEFDMINTALRECKEEVGFAPARSSVAGMLPSFPTFTGNFEVTPVLASVPTSMAELLLSTEVTVAEWVNVRELIATRREEVRLVSGTEIRAPYFMWSEKKMWGLSAWIFDLIVKRYDTI